MAAKAKSKKPAGKKTAVKSQTKKPASKKTTSLNGSKKPALKIPVIKEPLKKSALVSTISDSTGLGKSEAKSFLDAFVGIMQSALSKKGAGIFILPGCFKMATIMKPATKARKGVNPFTGEEMMIKAKPARRVVKIRALKQLKDSLD